jgi:hypothetical protein
LVADPT